MLAIRSDFADIFEVKAKNVLTPKKNKRDEKLLVK
ncbi:hypothetical protein [Nostoc sp. PA-18-2419]